MNWKAPIRCRCLRCSCPSSTRTTTTTPATTRRKRGKLRHFSVRARSLFYFLFEKLGFEYAAFAMRSSFVVYRGNISRCARHCIANARAKGLGRIICKTVRTCIHERYNLFFIKNSRQRTALSQSFSIKYSIELSKDIFFFEDMHGETSIMLRYLRYGQSQTCLWE